ncbi:MAG: C4-dicarboxylic acid transporter DauA [Pseudomonadota bacterium]|jgi:SulP family sulfate permease
MAFPTFSFRPKLVDALQGYNRERLGQDISAGVTVGLVALPLAMAFAIASGLSPEAGIFTAIIASLAISLLGGSRVQIGGPAGAFIVIVYGILEQYGLANLIIATAMSGVLLFVMGMLRMGTLVRFVPVAVVIGFTNGIAVLIGLSQLKDFLGLEIAQMPADFFGMGAALYDHIHTFNAAAFGIAVLTLALLLAWQWLVPQWTQRNAHWGRLKMLPGSIVGLVVATFVSVAMGLDIPTIGSKFGGIPAALPAFQLPEFSWQTARYLLMPTLTLALLGAIESLLCARVADGMIGDRHNPNQELMAQGVANFVTPFFGGMPATGTIARTVTNIKSGANSPIAGVVHALTLLVIVLIAAPLASSIPLAALSAILMFVAWNMGEWRAFSELRQFRLPYRATLLAVFLLTVVFDLTVAVEVGLFAAALTFIYRISSLTRAEPVTTDAHPVLSNHAGAVSGLRLYGALFFGAVKLIENIEEHLPSRVLIVDVKNLIYIDSSGADALHDLLDTCEKKGVQLILSGVDHQPHDMLQRSGLLKRMAPESIVPDLASAVRLACH